MCYSYNAKSKYVDIFFILFYFSASNIILYLFSSQLHAITGPYEERTIKPVSSE